MPDPISEIEKNIVSKWWKGFLYGSLTAIGLFIGVLKIFPMLFEKILKEDYVLRKDYDRLKNIKKDSSQIDKVPNIDNTHKNSNTQIGKDNSNTQQ